MDPSEARLHQVHPSVPAYYKPVAYWQVSVVAAAHTLLELIQAVDAAQTHLPQLLGADKKSLGRFANAVAIYSEDNDIRYADAPVNGSPADGTVGTPTASVGYPIPARNEYLYTGDLDLVKLIRQSADAKVNLQFFLI